MVLITLRVRSTQGPDTTIRIDNELTVADLRDAIRNQTGIPNARQRLIFGGQLLSDNSRILRDIGLVDNTTLHMVTSTTSLLSNLTTTAASGTAATPTAVSATTRTGADEQQVAAAPTDSGIRIGLNPEQMRTLLQTGGLIVVRIITYSARTFVIHPQPPSNNNEPSTPPPNEHEDSSSEGSSDGGGGSSDGGGTPPPSNNEPSTPPPNEQEDSSSEGSSDGGGSARMPPPP